MTKEEIQTENGGEWIAMRSPEDDICGLGCGGIISEGESCHKLVNDGEVVTLLCDECWDGE